MPRPTNYDALYPLSADALTAKHSYMTDTLFRRLWVNQDFSSVIPTIPKMKSPQIRALDCILTTHDFRREQDIFKNIQSHTINYREICIQCGQYYVVHPGHVSPSDPFGEQGQRSKLFQGPEGRMYAYWYEKEIVAAVLKNMLILQESRICYAPGILDPHCEYTQAMREAKALLNQINDHATGIHDIRGWKTREP